MQRGNQHGGRKYDNLQNLLEMTSHENPLSSFSLVEPTFTRMPVDTTVKLGETALLHCRATGSPQPVIFWRKENMEVSKILCPAHH